MSTTTRVSIESVRPIIGLEIHVELRTRTRMFTGAPNVAHPEFEHAEPNTLIDPVVLGLPGSLPVMNRTAVELSMLVGLALGCRIAERSVWDRKSYFYPDLPKNYQISQYELPLCFDGSVELPPMTADGKIDLELLAVASAAEESTPRHRIGVLRAHLEEDAGKLLHDSASGATLADYNRAGTPLLEIVTQPDFRSSAEVVVFCQMLRDVCRFVGATQGVMQKGHMRFEPNINAELTLSDGRLVWTPITEVKNLNSFKAVGAAIEHELREQPKRWLADGVEFGPGSKTTRGWDDARGETFVQREKEDAHDYRYFPDPDLVPVVVDSAWLDSVRARLPELPLARARRYLREFGLGVKEAAALIDEPAVSDLFDAAVDSCERRGIGRERAGKLAAIAVLQWGLKRANERTAVRIRRAEEAGRSGATALVVLASDLGVGAEQIAGILAMRESGAVSAASADELFGLLCSKEDEPGESAGRGGGYGPGADPEVVAEARGMIIVRDDSAIDAWCEQVIAADPKAAEDVRSGKVQAAGRLVGAAMKLAAGKADAKTVRARLMEKLGVKE
ncbi:MAG: Asp-tRNA(Asn)/Glu-tRNA(Gln) amidotransferase subunit GatB [Phycisphaeraceae bacterium]|nr:Asp-tRNA(Asn)/Glu-tRNA(Gln) amidotransferase subunit GatB [Phycisphaeraceae bacterium]